MKKVIVVLSMLMLLAGCNTEGETEGDGFTGVLKILEASYFQYGTHTLESENGELLFALKSDDLNLDPYHGLMVKVNGDLISGYPVDGGPEYLDVTAIVSIE